MTKRSENNFKRAVNELLSPGTVKSPTSAERGSDENSNFASDNGSDTYSSVDTDTSSADTLDKSESSTKTESLFMSQMNAVPPVSASFRPQSSISAAPVQAKREEAVIPSDMVITGNISTKSNMNIMGNVIGDIECEGNLHLLGSVKGNVSAGGLTIQRGSLNGNAFVKENIIIENDSVLEGNITAQNIYSNASTKGQISATGAVELREKAVVEGDISAATFSVSAGTKIKGMVSISD